MLNINISLTQPLVFNVFPSNIWILFQSSKLVSDFRLSEVLSKFLFTESVVAFCPALIPAWQHFVQIVFFMREEDKRRTVWAKNTNIIWMPRFEGVDKESLVKTWHRTWVICHPSADHMTSLLFAFCCCFNCILCVKLCFCWLFFLDQKKCEQIALKWVMCYVLTSALSLGAFLCLNKKHLHQIVRGHMSPGLRQKVLPCASSVWWKVGVPLVFLGSMMTTYRSFLSCGACMHCELYTHSV